MKLLGIKMGSALTCKNRASVKTSLQKPEPCAPARSMFSPMAFERRRCIGRLPASDRLRRVSTQCRLLTEDQSGQPVQCPLEGVEEDREEPKSETFDDYSTFLCCSSVGRISLRRLNYYIISASCLSVSRPHMTASFITDSHVCALPCMGSRC